MVATFVASPLPEGSEVAVGVTPKTTRSKIQMAAWKFDIANTSIYHFIKWNGRCSCSIAMYVTSSRVTIDQHCMDGIEECKHCPRQS